MAITDWTNDHRTSYDRVTNGNDLLEPGHDWQETYIIEAVKAGKLQMSDVDARIKDILEIIL